MMIIDQPEISARLGENYTEEEVYDEMKQIMMAITLSNRLIENEIKAENPSNDIHIKHTHESLEKEISKKLRKIIRRKILDNEEMMTNDAANYLENWVKTKTSSHLGGILKEKDLETTKNIAKILNQEEEKLKQLKTERKIVITILTVLALYLITTIAIIISIAIRIINKILS